MRTLLLAMLLLSLAPLLGYQDAGFTVFTPTTLSEKESELSIFHRFQGPLDQDVWNTLFGLNAGANVSVGYRRNIFNTLEGKASYTRSKKRLEIGASWRPTSEASPVAVQLDAAWFTFAETGVTDRRNNFLYILSASNKNYSERGTLTLNAGYDGYYQRFLCSIALHTKIKGELALVGEYYPVLDRDSASEALQARLGDHDSFAIGVKFGTYGHQFMFSISNAWQNHPATMSLGTDSNDLYFGFNIQRRFF